MKCERCQRTLTEAETNECPEVPVCADCMAYLEQQFGPLTDDLTDAALDEAFQDALDKED